MPSILKSLLGGSTKSQSSSRKKLKKGGSTRSQRPPHLQSGHDRHPDERGSAYSDEMYGQEKHGEFADSLPLRPIHPSRAHEHAILGASGHYPDITYAATRYPANMPRYELYDPAGPGPLPVASLHQVPSREFHEQRSVHGSPGVPSIHYFPSNFQPIPVPPPRAHPDASWEPIPDVHRESTIADPEAYRDRDVRGYDSEEERWMRAQEEHTPSEGYGRFVAPGRVRSDHRSVRSTHREEIIPQHNGEGEWEWADNRPHRQPSVGAVKMHPVPSHSPITVPLHREDMDRVHQPHPTPAPSLRREHSMVEQRSNRLSTGSGSKFQEHIVSPEQLDKPSLKKKISNIFSTKGAHEQVQEMRDVPLSISRSHSRKSGVEGKTSSLRVPIRHIQAPVDTSRHSQISTDSFEEDWREDGDVYQYIVPAGVNIIFKDKHGNEITRVGDYPDSAMSKRRSRRSAPIVVIDQNGTVLYDEGKHSRTKSPEALRSASPRSAGSGSSSPSAKTILISPKGDQFHLGGSATSRSSGSGSQRGRDNQSRPHRI